MVSADYNTENAATYATNAINARIAACADRHIVIDALELAELVELVDDALLREGEGDVESPWSAGEDLLVAGGTVRLGFLESEILAPPWIGNLEIYWVCVVVLLCATIVHIARVFSDNVQSAAMVN